MSVILLCYYESFSQLMLFKKQDKFLNNERIFPLKNYQSSIF